MYILLRSCVRKGLGFLSLTPFIFGCAMFGHMPSQDLKPEVFYQRDLKIKVGNLSFDGYGVAPEQIEYKLKLFPPADADYVLLETCNREVRANDQGDEFEYNYKPIIGLETKASCPMNITVLDEDQVHSFGFLAFEDSAYKLSAYLKCNGDEGTVNAVSACQSKQNLKQRISFLEPVKASPEVGCDKGHWIDNQTYEYSMPYGQCVILFQGDSGASHIHFTIGYKEGIVRN